MSETANMTGWWPCCSRDLGDVEAAEGALDAVRARYEEAQARATAAGNGYIAATTMFALAKRCLREGDRAGARRAVDEALTTLRAARTSDVEA